MNYPSNTGIEKITKYIQREQRKKLRKTGGLSQWPLKYVHVQALQSVNILLYMAY